MGNSACSRRSEAVLTEADVRERRLQRLAGAAPPTAKETDEGTAGEAKMAPVQVPAPTEAKTLVSTPASAPAPAPAPAPAAGKAPTAATSATAAPVGSAPKLSKVTSSGAVAEQATQVVRKLVQDADYRTIELVLSIVNDVLKQPKTSQRRCIRLTDVRGQLRPDASEKEACHLRAALVAIGFEEIDLESSNARLELTKSDDLALARELARKIENTRCRWKPAHVDKQAREDAQPGEVMNATGCNKQHALAALSATGYDTVFAIEIISKGPKDEDGKPMRSHAHILNVQNQAEEFVKDVWSSRYEALREYKDAADTICLSRRWIVHTKLGRILASIDAEFKQDPALLKEMEDMKHLEDVLFKLIMKGYNLSERDSVKQQMTPPCGMKDEPCNVFDTLWHFCFIGPPRLLGGGNPQPLKYVTWSFCTLLALEESHMIEIKLYELCDVAHRCGSARKQTFNSLVTHCCNLRDAKTASSQSVNQVKSSVKTPRELANARLEECMEDFLDDHKVQAFTSAFVAPARYYLHHTGHKQGSLNMSVHGLNWYLTLVHAALGMPLPLSGHYDDHHVQHPGLVDFWKGLTLKAWSFFSDPANFGKYFADLPKLPEGVEFIGDEKVEVGELPEGMEPGPKAMCFGNNAVNPGHEHAAVRQKLAIYLERFAYFFRAEFFARKAFETLNSESKAEHVGFRDAAQTLYCHYRIEELNGEGEESLLEHCYKDEYFMKPDVHRMVRFFTWLGIIKDCGSDQVARSVAHDSDSDDSDLFS
eukprot:TRINITY_DN32351_c0_g1_i1.p1 TRINITY_DN32351_c0_g1~~TRINITY_DN32351_c0_g1_i1.p1  ORF type:complete len:764 (+),score=124.31 TRINITY_DN32351_c0_g1_i1:51-2342(+)